MWFASFGLDYKLVSKHLMSKNRVFIAYILCLSIKVVCETEAGLKV